MQKEKVIYTCITGGYDNITAHPYVDDTWDYVLFTDDAKLIEQGVIHHWCVKPLPFAELDNSRNSRFPKINAHLVLPEYRYSFYLDGNITILSAKFFSRLDRLIQQKTLIAIAQHPQRNCLYQEAEIVKKKCIDMPETVDTQMEFLQSEDYPKQRGLFENNLIFRQHTHKDISSSQDLWWQMLVRFSKRDQLSAAYAFWKYNIPIEPLYTRGEAKVKRQELCITTTASHNRYLANSKSIFPAWCINSLVALCPAEKYKHKIRHKLESYRKTTV